MFTFVMAMDGTRLMPTSNVKKVRKLLRSGKARICQYNPFAIQLLYESEKNVQPVELTEDTGYLKIGLSVKSEAHEYASREYTTLKDEKEHHDNCRNYRRQRRSRKRYRKPRFDNRKSTKPEGWIAPSLEHKADIHVREAVRYIKVCPVTKIHLEMGQFDTQVLAAVAKGEPIPESVGYQHGPRYGFDTLREAVFARDNHTCRVCGKSAIKNGMILRMHHIYYWRKDHTDRMDGLAAVCAKCHCPANHQPGGKLFGWDPKLAGFQGAAYMNTVKWRIYEKLKTASAEIDPDCKVMITYGAVTKRERLDRHIEKSHVNDAYCIGEFHPKHRAKPRYFEKVRRQNRVLSKFYDAKYIDRRDGSIKKGAELPNGRVNRSHKLDTENLRVYRKRKVKKGKTVLRTKRYLIQPGDVVMYKKNRYIAIGTQSNGKSVVLKNQTEKVSPSVNRVKLLNHGNGWKEAFKGLI